MGVSIELSHVRQHGIQHTRVGWGGCLHIHVNRARVVDILDLRYLETKRLYNNNNNNNNKFVSMCVSFAVSACTHG